MESKIRYILKQRVGYQLIFFIFGLFLILNGKSNLSFQKDAQIGDRWIILSTKSKTTLYAFFKTPKTLNIESNVSKESNRYIVVKKFPAEIEIKKVGGTNQKKYFFVDFYATHRFAPDKKFIVGRGWIPLSTINKARKIKK